VKAIPKAFAGLLVLASGASAQAAPRLVISPAARSVVAGDSVQFSATLVDESGKPVPDSRVTWRSAGFPFEGRIDSTGKFVAGAVGTLPIAVIGIVPGAKPVVQRLEIAMVPGPATLVEVAPRPTRLAIGQRVYLTGTAFSKAHDRRPDRVAFASDKPSVLRVSNDGAVQALAPGRAVISATAGAASEKIPVEVVATPVASVEVQPSTAHVRTGDVVHLRAIPRDAQGREIKGLTPSWLFTPGNGLVDDAGAFVAYQPGTYQVTASFGARTGDAVVAAVDRDIKRPLTVVSKLIRSAFATSEVWIHPNGNVAYLGTIMGGDRVYAVDISDPAKPTIVDSIVVNARSINDMMTTPDGNTLVITREGAADRKNGIVIADTHDPLHPKEISQFTDGVAGGVHSIYIYEHPEYGRFVYLTNDGTGAIDIVNLSDPAKPVRAGEWHTDRPDAARYVHDLDIVDGLLYASYWNDGLVILDIGNGKWGGRPDKPTLVSQFKYNLDSLYRDVEDVSAPGFTRGTHTAWRQRGGKYVFIADEVYLNGSIQGAKDASSSRMYGTLQVIDVSDIAHPKSVAWYTPEMGGVHNVWQAGDTLYMGAYDAGFHVFDISGELKGDLRAQQREMASLNTADMGGVVQNAAFDWGVVVNPKDGLAYVNDFNNGLWVVRVNPRRSRGPAIP